MNDAPGGTVELIQNARVGDAGAKEALLRRYREYVRLLVRSQTSGRLQARVDSSDLIQETLLRAAQNIHQFHGSSEEEWQAWLARIAKHEIIHQRRRHLGAAKRAAIREERWTAESDGGGASLLMQWFAKDQSSPSLAAMRNERALLLANVLALLPQDYREVLILRHLDGLDFPEVAERMRRSAGAVRVLWTRALRKLREEMQKSPPLDY